MVHRKPFKAWPRKPKAPPYFFGIRANGRCRVCGATDVPVQEWNGRLVCARCWYLLDDLFELVRAVRALQGNPRSPEVTG
jgi:hypothetical protein